MPTLAGQLDGLGSLILVVLVIALASVVQLASGFGFALLCVPLLALVIDPHTAVLMALLLGMLGTAYQAVTGRGDFDTGVVVRLLSAAMVGMPLGLLVFSFSSPQDLKIIIGAMILATTALLCRGFTIRERSPSVDLCVGLLTGLLTTSTGTSGPPVVAVLQARGVTADVFRATASVVFTVVDVVAIVGFTVQGRVTWPLLALAICTLPGMGLGAWIGVKVRPLLSPRTFRVLVLVLLALSGLIALTTAVL